MTACIVSIGGLGQKLFFPSSQNFGSKILMEDPSAAQRYGEMYVDLYCNVTCVFDFSEFPKKW